MNNSSNNLFNRESLFSSSSTISNESISSDSSEHGQFLSCCFHCKRKTNKNEESKTQQSNQPISCTNQILFFGPLVLCLILLITGVIIFIIVEHRNKKQEDAEMQIQNEKFNFSLNDSYLLSCSFKLPEWKLTAKLAFNEVSCALNRSSLLSIHFSNHRPAIHPGQKLGSKDALQSPRVFLNRKLLPKIPAESFLLIFVYAQSPEMVISHLSLYWIRYYSSSLKNEEDICYYEWGFHGFHGDDREAFLFYATNSSQMMIQAKTFCTHYLADFPLFNYISFLKLQLISATYFVAKSDPADYDDEDDS